MRVAIAHESRSIATALLQAVAAVKEWRTAWVVHDGATALARVAEDQPDLLLISPQLPGVDGIELTRRVVHTTSCLVMVVTERAHGRAADVFEAMGAGAIDAVEAPSVSSEGQLVIEDVVRKLKVASRLVGPQTPSSALPTARTVAPGGMLVAIGASTGGPAALAEVLAALPEHLAAAVVVVQHVDQQFTANLATWLSAQTSLPLKLAQPGVRPEPGTISLTASNDDLVVTASRDFALRRPKDGTFYHPSVDVFFESAAAHWPGPGVGVLLTGIGRDGAEGLLALRNKGWHTIAQDEHTSVVYGMPRAAAELKAAKEILPLNRIGAAVARYVGERAGPKRGQRG